MGAGKVGSGRVPNTGLDLTGGRAALLRVCLADVTNPVLRLNDRVVVGSLEEEAFADPEDRPQLIRFLVAVRLREESFGQKAFR